MCLLDFGAENSAVLNYLGFIGAELFTAQFIPAHFQCIGLSLELTTPDLCSFHVKGL